jgi:agmatine/peptidylarginine deiminase/PKD repeat protein
MFLSLSVLAQEPALPRHPTPEEIDQMGQGMLSSPKSFNPNPPPAPVRTMAEWEEVEAVVITWTGYTSILTEIVRHAVNECTVIIITGNPGSTATALTNSNISLDNVILIQRPFDSVWIRDYGPWSVYQNDVDSLAIVDWIYNRPRYNDDVIPQAIAQHLGLPFYEATLPPDDLVHAGGNHLPDGMFTTFSSDLVLDENLDKTSSDLSAIFSDYLGVENYVILPKLPFDGIHHIDMHMRIIDEETIIIGEYPEGVSDGPAIEDNIRLIKSRVPTYFGNQYNIIRIPMPPDQFNRYPDQEGYYRTYTNSLFLNKTIIVPVYEEQYDTTALRIYRENLPGYNVVGIDCNDIIPASGALHCITKLVGSGDPLWIAHPRLRDTYDTENDYLVQAVIKHRSGISAATLYYRMQEEGAYSEVPMSLTFPDEDTWTAAIPAQAAGTTIHYYIEAVANSGKQQVRPLVAPEGYFRFRVKALDLPVAGFYYDIKKTCIGQNIQFNDDSRGVVESRLWNFPGGEPATSTLPDPIVSYPDPGVYDVTLTVSNGLGNNAVTKTAIVAVEAGGAPFFEDFTGGPNPSWEIDNPQQDNAFWTVFSNGNCSGSAFRMNNKPLPTKNTNDYFRSRFDLDGMAQVILSFDVAYAPHSLSRYDALRVNIIPCNGEKTAVYTKYGLQLATAPPNTNVFIPSSCDQWRHEEVDLSAFAGQTVVIEFENVGGSGNMLYIDNIDISDPTPNLAPFVQITSPQDGAVFQDELPVFEIAASAEDPDGQVAFVTFFVNGDSIGIGDQAPYFIEYAVPAFGEYALTARATDDEGAETFSDVVTVRVEQTTATATPAAPVPLEFTVFPNPAKSELTISFQAAESMDVQLRVLDLLGRVVLNSETLLQAGMSTRQIDISRLPGGTYLLDVVYSKGRAARKVLINN